MRRYTAALLTTICMIAIFSLTLVSACRKQSCYSEALKQQYKDVGCTADCSGVTGCDGKTYCNECEAARNGIRIK